MNAGACLGRSHSPRFVGGLLRPWPDQRSCRTTSFSFEFRAPLHLNATREWKPLQFVPRIDNIAPPRVPYSCGCRRRVGKMFAMQDKTGKPLFESISITLVCGALW